jgi:hypothetical protein
MSASAASTIASHARRSVSAVTRNSDGDGPVAGDVTGAWSPWMTVRHTRPVASRPTMRAGTTRSPVPANGRAPTARGPALAETSAPVVVWLMAARNAVASPGATTAAAPDATKPCSPSSHANPSDVYASRRSNGASIASLRAESDTPDLSDRSEAVTRVIP